MILLNHVPHTQLFQKTMRLLNKVTMNAYKVQILISLLYQNQRISSIFQLTGKGCLRGLSSWYTLHEIKLEQLERLRSEDTPHRLMITHTIGSQVKKIIDLELKTLQSRHDFQSQGQMTLKI